MTNLIIRSISCLNGLTLSQARNYRRQYTKRLSLEQHHQIAAALWGAKRTAMVDRARCTLDDIVQMEYPSRAEMPDEVFFRLYYDREGARGEGCVSKAAAALVTALGDAGTTKGYDPRYRPLRAWATRAAGRAARPGSA